MLILVPVAVAALAMGLTVAQAQEKEPLLTAADELTLLRAERLDAPGDIAAVPERLFLGNCASCHGTGPVGNGEVERLTQVILHGCRSRQVGNTRCRDSGNR